MALFISGYIGLLLGGTVGHPEAGFWLGFFFGPIGYVIVLLLPPNRSAKILPKVGRIEPPTKKIRISKVYSIDEMNEKLRTIGDKVSMPLLSGGYRVDTKEGTSIKLKDYSEIHQYYTKRMGIYDSTSTSEEDLSVVTNEPKQKDAKTLDISERLSRISALSDIDERLSRISTLLDQGAISEEEAAKSRERILSEI